MNEKVVTRRTYHWSWASNGGVAQACKYPGGVPPSALRGAASRCGRTPPVVAWLGILQQGVVVVERLGVELDAPVGPALRVHLDVLLEVVVPVEGLLPLLGAKRALDPGLLVGSRAEFLLVLFKKTVSASVDNGVLTLSRVS